METGNSIIMRKNLDLFFRIFLFSNLGIIDRQCAICTHRPSVYFVSGFALLISFFFVTYTDRQFAICTHRPSVYFVSGFATYKNRERYSLVSKLSIFVRWLIAYLYMISCLPGPFDTIVIGTSNSFSINSMYLRQFSGSLSYSVIPLISSFHPGSTL